eukprot:g6119.t1
MECTALDSDGISATAITTNRRFIAIAEKGERATVAVYDLQTLKRKKVLVSVETGSKEIVSLSFSHDGTYLAAQGGAPDWCLGVWIWEKAKIVASTKTVSQSTPLQCLFSPTNNNILCVGGSGGFKQYRLAESSLKLQPHVLSKQECQDFRSFGWSTDGEQLIAGNGNGEVIAVEGSEVVWSCQLGHNVTIESLISTTERLVVGTGVGEVVLFDRDEKERFRKGRFYSLKSAEKTKVVHLSVSPLESHVLCATDAGQIFTMNFSTLELPSVENKGFNFLFYSLHSGGILATSTCIRKQLIVTCGEDKTIRLWNYFSKNTELVKHFIEEALSVTLHPNGTSLVVGFADKLRLFTILIDDLKLIKEFPIRACRECCFATGGQYFAAVAGNNIVIYSTYTCDLQWTLRGHNGKVTCLHWSPDDLYLISTGMDGAIYEWDLHQQNRRRENVLKGCHYSSVITPSDSNSILAVGSDRKLKELENIQGAGTQITKDLSSDVLLTQLAISQDRKLLFAGTEKGTIRSYKYPLSGDFYEYKCQTGPISKLVTASGGNMLISSSRDGSLFIFEVKSNDLESKLHKEQSTLPWAEEVLVTKSELDEKKHKMMEMETKVNELTMQTEYQLRMKDLTLQEKLKEESDRHETDFNAEKRKFELLSQEKNDMELEFEEKLRLTQEKSRQQLDALDSQYQQKILNEVERYQQLAQEKETLNTKWTDQNGLLVEAHETSIKEITEEYESKLKDKESDLEAMERSKEFLEEEFEEIKHQLEEDADREVHEIKRRFEKKLMDEREVGLRLKGQNGIMRKKFNALQNDIEAQKEEIKALFDQKRELYQDISSLEKDILGLKKEVKERDETISDKERRIYDLKKKNQELEKFKFVLDFKIKELKDLIDPKEEEIENFKEQIQEMDQELQKYQKTSSSMELVVANLRMKQKGTMRQLELERKSRIHAYQNNERFSRSLQDVVQFIQNPKVLKQKVLTLYHEYGQLNDLSEKFEERNESEFER